MSSAFKNFFITFLACLVVFAFVGYKFVYPFLTEATDMTDMNDVSSEAEESDSSEAEESEVSETVDIIDSTFKEEGDIFTSVVMAVDDNGIAVAAVFIDANGKTSQYVYSPINVTSTRIYNSVGELVPAGELFAMLSNTELCNCMTAFTGMNVDFCIRFNRSSLSTIASLIPGASTVLSEDIQIIDPKYEDFVPAEGEEYPEDYFVTITNVDGSVNLNEKINGKTKLQWLLSYNPNPDGSEYNALYIQICRSLIKQFFENENSTKSSGIIAKVISCACSTNMTTDKIVPHLETIFSYNDYRRHELTCPYKWEEAQKQLRERDGRTDFSS